MIDFNNLSAIRYNFANVVYTKKIHEVHKDWESLKFIFYKLVTIFMTGLILASIIMGQVHPQQDWPTNVGIALAILEVLWLIVTLSFDPKQRYQAHHDTANRLYLLREHYIYLMTDVVNDSLTQKQISQRRNELLDESKSIYDMAPSTKNRAYQAAGKKLKSSKPNRGEDATLTDDEIDHFLPKMLQYQYQMPYER